MSTKKTHYIYLIPGFFGFSDLGGITYFHHVREILTELFEGTDITPIIHSVDTYPTASIRKRAHRLYEQVVDTALEPDAPIHLIGHSTGGLDARLLVTPNASLLNDVDTESIAKRVKSVTTIATPHLGTPIASFFNSLLGQKLLYMMSVGTIYAMKFGRLPMAAMFKLVGLLSKVDDRLGFEDNILDQFYKHLFAEFNDEHAHAVSLFLESVRTEQSLLGQLTPGGIDLLNAAAEDRESTRYGCVTTQARPPSLGAVKDIGFDPYKQASHVMYTFLWKLVSSVPDYPNLSSSDYDFLVNAYGDAPALGANDGMVPTRSQLHGELIHSCWADHLDVCGHFSAPSNTPPHIDWIASSSGFSPEKFDHLWEDVVEFMLDASS
jgi:triacylglycerol esterase/lipase EstA (alpha/beta hydrolase family)